MAESKAQNAKRPMRTIIGVTLVAVVSAVASWLVAVNLESPEQVAARASPPKPVPVTATLRAGYVNPPVTMATTAQYETSVKLRPPASLTGVVTANPTTAGVQMQAGSVLMRIDGRPVFVLPGNFALYRDIMPEQTGDDVVAVQDALRSAGYKISDKSGVYGASTQAALKKMYKAAGQTPPTAASAPAEDQPAAPSSGATSSPSTPSTGGTPQVPVISKSELVMTPQLPATLLSVLQVGAAVAADSELAVLGAGKMVIGASLPTSAANAVTVGAVGTFTDAAGASAEASLASINPGADETTRTLTWITEAALSAGAPYVLTIANPAGEATTSILAPAAAVVARGGRSYIYIADGGKFREVEVTVTGSSGGVAAIAPVDPKNSVTAGMEVRVG